MTKEDELKLFYRCGWRVSWYKHAGSFSSKHNQLERLCAQKWIAIYPSVLFCVRGWEDSSVDYVWLYQRELVN